ncbi:hypothetical protein PRUPE_2G046500 [Prunus persica]|uniref:Uncharacterized protein n=1 Tax=Prunus persica TaxID=3760 RepID=A0A251QB82_PRUPE|nr:hypothetical protein PRUPE_2G046500 [Prunus persica]
MPSHKQFSFAGLIFHVTARGEFTVVYRFLFFYKQIVANKGEGNLLQVEL